MDNIKSADDFADPVVRSYRPGLQPLPQSPMMLGDVAFETASRPGGPWELPLAEPTPGPVI
jgi:hypothetical protein